MSSEPEFSRTAVLRPFHGGGSLEWDGLRPRGGYWRIGRPLLNGLLFAVSLPAVLLIALPFGLCYGLYLGGWRKVLFAQERVGQHGKPFILYKFRTMRDAEGGAFESWRTGDLGRVTRVGGFLRRSHLDELPQIINVLRGEMTFIGPRPEMFATHRFALDHISEFSQRLALRPGITGLAQVVVGYVGPDPEEYRAKFEQDEEYRLHFGFGQDLFVLVHTAVRVLQLRGWTARTKSGRPFTQEYAEPCPEAEIVPPPPIPRERSGHGSVKPRKKVRS
jgi:lipopolysaccharide/colanic/teichoic acid biosynthesis glycosyltransferase